MIRSSAISRLGRPKPCASLTALALGALLTMGVGVGSASADTFFCDVIDVAVYDKPLGARMHARCAIAAPGGIAFFALGLKSKAASLFFGILNSALLADKSVNIVYDPNDLSGAKIGCQTNDCRLIQAAVLVQ